MSGCYNLFFSLPIIEPKKIKKLKKLKLKKYKNIKIILLLLLLLFFMSHKEGKVFFPPP
jgi:hypothetical protein